MKHFKTAYAKIAALVSREGHTAFGKAVEHAVVAGVSVGVSLLVDDLVTGSLSMSDVSAALVVAGSAVLAGIRAAVKTQVIASAA